MSEFLAEARVVIRPDTTRFRAELEAQLKSATAGVTIPIAVSAAGAVGAVGAFAALSEVQRQAIANAEGIATANRIANTSWASQAVILQSLAERQEQAAGATDQLNKRTRDGVDRSAQFNKGILSSIAGLTGLRGAVLAASGPFLGAAVASTAFLKSLQAFATFETELNVFSATTEATAEQMERVSALAEELGADLTLPAVSATDAASAMTELAKAGLTVEEAMKGARGVLQLSTAAGIGVGEAAQFAANELNAFGLAGDQAVRVADVLANAANAAQGDISDFGLAFKQSAAVANQVGLSLEATAAQLAVMARAGLQGSDAGTSLRVSLLRLINPTKDAQAIIKQLGIDLRDANGNIRPDVFVQFAEAMRGMTPAARDAAAATVFGADGIRTFAVAAQAGREGLVDATIAMGEQGTAAELAAARTAGFGGQLEALKSTASTTAISLGEISTVIAGPLVVGLTGLADLLNRVLSPMAELVRLSKDVLGISGTFDPTTASAAELLEKLREVQDDYAKLSRISGIGQEQIQGATEDAIRALESQRATLKALGVDTSGITAVIQQLQSELVNTEKFSVGAATASQKAWLELRNTIEALGENAPESLKRALREIEEQIQVTAREPDRFADAFEAAMRRSAAATDVLNRAMSRLRGEIAASSDELLRAQNANASPQAQIAILQGQEQTQRDLIDTIKSNGIQPGDPTAIREAREEIERIQGEIESLQNGILADQKEAAATSKRLADEAQDARDEQFEAIAEMFAGRQENIEDAIERAGIAGNIQAQIRLNKALIASLQKERAALLERLRILKVSADLRKKILEAISDAIEEAQQDILRLQKQQQDNIKEFATPAIDLRIRIAQARDDVAAEIALRRQRLQLITKELVRLKNAGKKNTIAWLELKAQQAEEISAINDLAEQNKTEGNNAAKFFFEQLQAQQGFAANLLGNLITGPTEGLVGVPAPTTGDRVSRPDIGSRINAESAAATGRAQIGPTAGQTNTEISILERILHELKRLNGSYDAPEAIHQKKVGAGNMDNFAM